MGGEEGKNKDGKWSLWQNKEKKKTFASLSLFLCHHARRLLATLLIPPIVLGGRRPVGLLVAADDGGREIRLAASAVDFFSVARPKMLFRGLLPGVGL